jgi:hypothetical protein
MLRRYRLAQSGAFGRVLAVLIVVFVLAAASEWARPTPPEVADAVVVADAPFDGGCR